MIRHASGDDMQRWGMQNNTSDRNFNDDEILMQQAIQNDSQHM
jgi:hypothetical protein